MRISTHSLPLRFLPACAGILLACSLARPAIAADAPAVSAGDQVQFQQKTVEAQMQELQERMFRLAALTREAEPDDAARLVMAVRKAREDLIIEQMRDVLEQLARADLSKASKEQEQVLVKLEELKKLLTSTDLDLQMQLERLRALTASIAKLDAATKEEQRQHDQSGALAKTAVDAKKLSAPQQEQKQNRQTTESIAEAVKDLGAGPAKAGATLGGACQSMSLAEGQLGASHPGDAAPLQSDAVATMQKAREQLEAERQKILDELQSQVRKQVVENLTEMLERQRSVRGATEAAGRLPSGEEQTVQRVRQLSPAENAIVRICDQTSDLIAETDFSVALPPALKAVRASCSAVSDQLQTGVADAALVDSEKRIEQDLQDLLDTFKQLASEPGPLSQCRGCKGNKNKLLAELKVLRMMQVRVNDRTARADGERAAHPATQPSAELNSTVAAIRDSQKDIETATQRIQAELSGGN
jgi:hypothetical protein